MLAQCWQANNPFRLGVGYSAIVPPGPHSTYNIEIIILKLMDHGMEEATQNATLRTITQSLISHHTLQYQAQGQGNE